VQRISRLRETVVEVRFDMQGLSAVFYSADLSHCFCSSLTALEVTTVSLH
jgi:hypothetical protein